MQSHGKALEEECCLPGVFRDSGDTPANLLCELNGHLMPCTSCFCGNWVEGRPRTAWVDNIKTWTRLPVEESVRMTEDRDKWRKYVDGVANPRIEDG